jgi:putative selenate reductase
MKPAMLPVEERGDFKLIEATFTEEEARVEGLRCVQCTTFCDKCVEVCPNRANYTFFIQPVRGAAPVLACRDGRLEVVGSEPFSAEQPRQILHVDDFCNECDDCQTFCVHHGKPYADKPRLFIDADGFVAEESNAFHIAGNTIRRREGGAESRLSLEDGGMIFENAQVRVQMSQDYGITAMTLKQPFDGTLSLREAAEMRVILAGVTASLPFLLK